jgi:hypothetical protein
MPESVNAGAVVADPTFVPRCIHHVPLGRLNAIRADTKSPIMHYCTDRSDIQSTESLKEQTRTPLQP